MRKVGLMAIYQKPRTRIPHPEHKLYSYLLRGVAIEKANQVWCADFSCVRLRCEFLWLMVIMDWHSRKVLSWRLPNTMKTDFCVAALEEALGRYKTPDIIKLTREASSQSELPSGLGGR